MKTSGFIQKTTGQSPFIDRRTFQIETLTPVHIGSGRKLMKGVDFTSSVEHTLIYDIDRLIKTFGSDQNFIRAIEKGNISKFLNDQGQADVNFAQTYPGTCHGRDLSEQMTDGMGNPIIPGSSLKGALKTALFKTFFDQKEMSKSIYFGKLKGYFKKPEKASETLQSELFAPASEKLGGTSNGDIGRVIRLSDVAFKRKDLRVFDVKILNLGGGQNNHFQYGWKRFGRGDNLQSDPRKGTSISVLGIDFDCKRKLTGSLDTNCFDNLQFNIPMSWKSLAEWENKHARHLIDYERKYFQNYFPDGDEDIEAIKKDLVEILDAAVDQSEKETVKDKISFVMRLGWGSGWHSMTGAHIPVSWLPDIRKKYGLGKRGHPVFPKTRRISMDGELAALGWGWIKITEIDG